SRPAIGLRIVDFVRSEHAAKIVDPTFASQNVNFSVENGDTRSRARCWHRRARRPSVGGNVIGLVHPHIRRPPAGIPRTLPPTDRVDFAVDVGYTVVIPWVWDRCKLGPSIGVGIDLFECAVEIDRPAADEAIGNPHPLRKAGATVHVYLLADGHR